MASSTLATQTAVRIINGRVVEEILRGREREIIEQVKVAYDTHYCGHTNLPHSVFLRFPENVKNRIISLPAYLGGETNAAGIKWIASFPGNVERSLDRASAMMILNDISTGFPKAILESSIISARRTAASATLAATQLSSEAITSLGLIGCGLIGFEIIRFMKSANPSLTHIFLYDLSSDSATHFAQKCQTSFPGLAITIATSVADVFNRSPVIALATTCASPYILDEEMAAKAKLILNISLRDISPEIILRSINVVDDIDHVCREKTSIHLAETLSGDRDFIFAELAEIVVWKKVLPNPHYSTVIFSPFGLGVLDLAIAELVYREAVLRDLGLVVDDFFPSPWRAAS